jgi:hypothetical protein
LTQPGGAHDDAFYRRESRRISEIISGAGAERGRQAKAYNLRDEDDEDVLVLVLWEWHCASRSSLICLAVAAAVSGARKSSHGFAREMMEQLIP